MKEKFLLNETLNASRFSDHASLEKHFDSVAEKILNKVILVVDENSYRFTEIEFYFSNPSCHEDTYIHLHPLQKKTGQWYFHGSGLDITFGDGTNYGGILIRGVMAIGKSEIQFISGPLKVVGEIFRSFVNISVREHNFHIKETESLPSADIAKSTRVGLKAKPGDNFHEKYYRYIAFPFEKGHDYVEKTKVAYALLDREKQIGELIEMKADKINDAFGWKIIKS